MAPAGDAACCDRPSQTVMQVLPAPMCPPTSWRTLVEKAPPVSDEASPINTTCSALLSLLQSIPRSPLWRANASCPMQHPSAAAQAHRPQSAHHQQQHDGHAGMTYSRRATPHLAAAQCPIDSARLPIPQLQGAGRLYRSVEVVTNVVVAWMTHGPFRRTVASACCGRSREYAACHAAKAPCSHPSPTCIECPQR